jgi:SAM-dependent methyltransferase
LAGDFVKPSEKFSGKEAPYIRRAQGFNGIRLDGIGDILNRANGATVFDIGCNRGMVGYEFAVNGAARVQGCDLFHSGIETARQVFADFKGCDHRFEIVDLSSGPKALKDAFGDQADWKHDIVLMLSVYHKLNKQLEPAALSVLIKHFGNMTGKYLCWRGHAPELPQLDKDLGEVGLKRVHTSFISDIQPAAIWARQ